MQPDFLHLTKQFRFNGEFISAAPYGHGHINDTYAAIFKNMDGSTHRYIIQRVNQNVFKKPEVLMDNIHKVTSHLRKKIIEMGGDPLRETLTLIPTISGSTYYRTESGDYWRAYVFIENARTYEIVENMDHVYNAAKTFGRFQQLMRDFPTDQLYETIPGFHHTANRYKNFTRAIKADVKNRAVTVKAEIDFMLQREADTNRLIKMIEEGRVTERITHNDTKLNNIMIEDDSGRGICVIDLDTVMPGLTLYDFGDSIRSMANPAAEDETDLSKVEFNMTVFDRFSQGYLQSTGDLLSQTEIELLPFSAKLMTLECGMRFLTDFLEGDVYYKTQYPNHNLDRCRTQFKLVQDMENRFEEMVKIVERYDLES